MRLSSMLNSCFSCAYPVGQSTVTVPTVDRPSTTFPTHQRANDEPTSIYTTNDDGGDNNCFTRRRTVAVMPSHRLSRRLTIACH